MVSREGLLYFSRSFDTGTCIELIWMLTGRKKLANMKKKFFVSEASQSCWITPVDVR